MADRKLSTKVGFQIEYEVKPSHIGPDVGMGIFTKNFIPSGSMIWKYCRDTNISSYSNKDDVKRKLDKMEQKDREFFMCHVYLFDGAMNEILDDGKYWNHSETPNTGYGSGPDVDWQSSYAIRDIDAGEELLDDYGLYEYPEWFIELAKEYVVPQDFITKKDIQKPGFHIAYDIRKSPIGGIGLFAKNDILKDSLIWKFSAGCNIKVFYTEREVFEHLSSLQTAEERYEWISHVYASEGYVNEICDDGKYWNHSETPNTVSGVNNDWDSTFAKRNIKAGEELLDDYGLYDYPDWLLKLYHEYNVPYNFVTIKTEEKSPI